MTTKTQVYLSGEIHTDWRDQIAAGVQEAGLPVELTSPVTDHHASDNCGVQILGEEGNSFWRDHKGAKINAIRTRILLQKADVVVVRFGEQYRTSTTAAGQHEQWQRRQAGQHQENQKA